MKIGCMRSNYLLRTLLFEQTGFFATVCATPTGAVNPGDLPRAAQSEGRAVNVGDDHAPAPSPPRPSSPRPPLPPPKDAAPPPPPPPPTGQSGQGQIQETPKPSKFLKFFRGKPGPKHGGPSSGKSRIGS